MYALILSFFLENTQVTTNLTTEKLQTDVAIKVIVGRRSRNE